MRPRGRRAALAPPTQRLAAATWTPASTTAPARSTCRYSSRVRAWTATAREVVPGSAVLSMIRTRTPSRVSQRASTRPVGPAPMIRTGQSVIASLPISRATSEAFARPGPRPDVYGASRPFREALRLDPEAAVEPRPEILPRDRRGQLHHLLRVEVLAQAVEQLLRDVGRRPRQRHGETQDALLQLGERRALLEGGQVGQLPFADPLPSAHGRVEVDSERAADEHGRLQAGDQLQPGGHRARGSEPALHLSQGPEQPRVVCRHLDGFDEAVLARQLAELPAHEPVSQPREPAGLRRLDALHVSHGSLPVPCTTRTGNL